MIAVLKRGTSEKQIESLTSWIEAQGLAVHLSKGEFQTIVGLIGDTTRIDEDLLRSLDIIETVKRISEPFKSANRKFHPDDSIIKVDNTSVGGDIFAVMAGPCSVESEAPQCSAAAPSSPERRPMIFRVLKRRESNFCLKQKRKRGFPSLPR